MSTKIKPKIKRLSFEMLYCKAKSQNEEFRKLSLGLNHSIYGSPNGCQGLKCESSSLTRFDNLWSEIISSLNLTEALLTAL